MELNRKNESKDMDKKLIRLTESDLHRIVKESVNRILNEVKYGLENAYRYKGYRMLKGGVVIDPNGKEIGKVDNPDEFGRMVNDHLSMRADDIENGREKLPPSQPVISYGTMEDDGDYRRYDMARRLRDRAYPPFERHQITQIR